MFDNLTDRLSDSLRKLRGQGRLTEANVQDALREVRQALLEADVALPVVKDFIEQVKERALGQEVQKSLTPGQAMIKIVNEELVTIMGKANEKLNLATQPPAVILMAGLQGAGKTTTVAKLARWIKENLRKSVLVASADVYRPAAIQQLETLASEVKAEFFPSDASERPVDIARRAVEHGRKRYMDVVIIDTAGRLHIDEDMMDEIKAVHAAIKPIETLFVVDSMTGQDAANTAKAFHDALPLTGVILTKTDGDARGGAALSIRHITGKPIKFMGVGEKTAALEVFHPDRVASRILGMGDVLSLIEDVERTMDKAKAEKLAKKIHKGRRFDLNDYRDQLLQLKNMGGLAAMLDKLPGVGNVPQHVKDKINDKEMYQQLAMIDSMTPAERSDPDILNPSRKRRITLGSGTEVQDLNRMLKQHEQMQKMMKKLKGGNIMNLMKGMRGQLGRRLPF
ncbi:MULTISPECIES: signal recognition particle protein [Methylococcus]|jgi:signal recognition particle subunit SRP54|uniref:Signal recognition particle protein n=2 Tax=Methylococcus capsulatus TaxID=414 RepID=Q608Z7_METCA|nr:signal recognition particle protein [Methylococcus capsulatus]AAU92610.1 signal recognition particle protein [Methylococcus capsulatus str. Bath]QXP87950.1 signal recognition particle protein [Methylococcus capsulatus]QXP90699.1 signal recognition particle protein [Methylococcus capsulatus]QXP92309.1 signal recognition particle protein [Methylococcus capsulatus]UQN12974.1 signal recognition particle protein [Methylococcus capsulatus]